MRLKLAQLFYLLLLSIGAFAQYGTWPTDTIRTSINTGNPKYPFPQFHGYAHGTSLSKKNAEGVTDADMEKTMREAYQIMMHRATYTGQTFKGKKYITFNNPTVPHNYNTFVSEGDGYALIAAAYFADKEAFDGLWLWIHDNRMSGVKKYYNCADLRAGYPYGRLPGWKNDETTPITNENPNGSAADGDFDIAMGLLIAHKQWGDNMGITDACGNQISYKEEALKFIKSMVDTVYYNKSISGAQPGTLGYLTGNIGVDGYIKSGNTWGEMTNWRVSAGNTMYPWAKSIPDPITTPSKYVDYMAPAYFTQFGKFLEQNGGTKWQIGQYKRSAAACDWIMGEMFKKGYIASAGTYTVSLDGATTTFGPFSDGEDFRLPWRTVLNYVWHGNPDSTWNPVTHQVQPGGNTFERDMGVRHGNFMKYAGSTAPTNPSPANALCTKLGASPDLSCPNWRGVSQIKQNYFQNGTASANYGSNFALGASAPAAVASGDHDLVAEMYRQSELVWDDASTKSSGLTDAERYILSTPKYFHGWFRVLGLLTNSGCLAPPDDMKPVANMKVYMAVDKTFAYEGDLLTYTVSYRNYGSLAASGVSIATTLDNNYQFVSATNGGTLSGNTITWTVGNVPGFTTGGLAATQGSMKFTIRVKSIATAVISCLTSTITSANSPSFTSNEYPNNASYTMERNCVDSC